MTFTPAATSAEFYAQHCADLDAHIERTNAMTKELNERGVRVCDVCGTPVVVWEHNECFLYCDRCGEPRTTNMTCSRSEYNARQTQRTGAATRGDER